MDNFDKERMVKLLKNGFFPKELPACFRPLNIELLVDNRGPFEVNGKELAALTTSHNVTRFGNFTRKIDITNPLVFYRLVESISSNFSKVCNKENKSPYCLTFPIENEEVGGRAFNWEHDWQDWKEEKIKRQTGFKYVLKTDISNFYPSIYTHIIPWILHGKDVAKKNNSPKSLFGNLLDLRIRNCQDRQTQGISIGPDTSFIVSELILNHIDCIIFNELKESQIQHRAARFVDDYEFYFYSNDDAKFALNIISRVLSNYELSLNPRKTEINDLPFEFDKEWVAKIRSCPSPRGAEKTRRQMVIDHFSFILKLQKKYADEQVLSYAISRIEVNNYLLDDDELFYSLLLNLAVYDSGTLKKIISFVNLDLNVLSNKKLTKIFNDVIPQIVKDCSERGRDNDVLWALILCYLFEVNINRVLAKIIYENGNALVKLMCIDLSRVGYMDFDLQLNPTRDEFLGNEWLLLYTVFTSEKYVKFRNQKSGFNTNEIVKHLQKLKVSFYDEFPTTKKIDDRKNYVKKMCEELVESEYKIEVDGELVDPNEPDIQMCCECSDYFRSINGDIICSDCFDKKILED